MNFIWGTLCGLVYYTVNAITMQMHSVTMEEIEGVAGGTTLGLRLWNLFWPTDPMLLWEARTNAVF